MIARIRHLAAFAGDRQQKNHYGSRSVRGTQVAALFYSLLESAKLVGIDPAAYLRTAVEAAFAGEQIPLPHEIAKRG